MDSGLDIRRALSEFLVEMCPGVTFAGGCACKCTHTDRPSA